MFLIGCVDNKNYLWMNNSIFLRPGSNDRLPIPWHHAFQISDILQCFHSKMCRTLYILYLYISQTWHPTYSAKICQHQCDWYTQSHISVFVVAVMLLSLRRACTSQMTAVEPSRKLPFWPERDVKGHDPVSYPTWRRLSANLRIHKCRRYKADHLVRQRQEFLSIWYVTQNVENMPQLVL